MGDGPSGASRGWGWLVSCDQSWASAAGDLPRSALLRRFPEKTEPISPEVRHKDSHLRADAEPLPFAGGAGSAAGIVGGNALAQHRLWDLVQSTVPTGGSVVSGPI